MRRKTRARVVAPLKEPVERGLGGEREGDAEGRAGARDDRSLGEHLTQQAARA